MSLSCLDKMIIEEDKEIAPQLKKMKLSSNNSPMQEIKKSSFLQSDPRLQLKSVFPYYSEEVFIQVNI